MDAPLETYSEMLERHKAEVTKLLQDCADAGMYASQAERALGIKTNWEFRRIAKAHGVVFPKRSQAA